ncbi:SDR family NAD(P)-dependent oxidoreductase [Actinocrispum sp. NPDC049592]|uniref:SDR family NAD(P)-dependent oxidoreductase n=1 Tax=Actinocrispum sp. NPDC049592 TaxID=3154835 RepID=UPI003422D293
MTGASRGAGRGISLALGEAGADVYLTGRTSRHSGSPTGRPETIEETAQLVDARGGGKGIPVQCDHVDRAQTSALFDRVRRDHGRLDVLVVNAWGGYEIDVESKPYWELDPKHWSLMLNAGLESHLTTVLEGTPLLREGGSGLVVLTTWAIGKSYHRHLFYDVIKTAINRMAFGIAHDLRPYGVTAIALSPGWMRTESMDLTPAEADRTESPEFVGRAIAALASDPGVIRHTGKTMTVIDVAREYGVTDIDGRAITPFWTDRLKTL